MLYNHAELIAFVIGSRFLHHVTVTSLARQLRHPAGVPKFKCFFYVILYAINLFDEEIDIKIRFIFFVQTVFL